MTADAPRPGFRSRLGLLPALLAGAAVAGFGFGVVGGWSDGAAGFPILIADAGRCALRWALGGAALFALLHAALAGWRRLGVLGAAAIAAAPLVAAGGYALNRRLGIRPSELFESYALPRNLVYLAACGLAVGILGLWMRRRGAGGTRRPARLLAATLAAWGVIELGLVAWSRAPRPKARPDILLILVDALRADHVGAYGYARATTPAIDQLARDAVLFEQAIAQSTFTKTSIASLFTGRFPYRHGVYWGSQRENPTQVTSDVLPASARTLAEVLRDHGYLTAAWVQNSHLRSFMGFAQGFALYHDQQGPVERIARRLEHFLDVAGRREPFFAYAHVIDLHDPYRPPPPYATLFGPPADPYAGIDLAAWGSYLEELRAGTKSLDAERLRQMEALYDGQIRRVDDRVGRLLGRLRRLGLYDSTVIVLTADHGDAFLEHGFISHSTVPYEELVRVPLLVKLADGRAAGSRVSAQVRLVDVMPTLLDLAGAQEQGLDLDGCSLSPLLRGEPALRQECGIAVVEIAENDAAPTLALRTRDAKFIRRPDRPDELYDLVADPRETRNLAGTGLPEEAVLARMAAAIAERRKATASEQVTLDPQLIRELKALGYLD